MSTRKGQTSCTGQAPCTRKNSRKGQTWSIDYTIGLLLFLFGIVISIKLLVNTFQDTAYEDLSKNSNLVINQLADEGYPYSWDKDNVLRIGILTKETINLTKLKQLYAMDPTTTRRYIPTRHDYYLFMEDKDNGIIYYNATCGYGSEDITNNGTVTYSTVAYYFSQGTDANLLKLASVTYQADLYHRNSLPGDNVNGYTMSGSLDNLTDSINSYDTIIMESPSFSTYTGKLNTTALDTLFTSWQRQGNSLLITGPVGTNLTGVEFPETADGAGNATIRNEHDNIPFHEDESMIFSRKYSLSQDNADDFSWIANYTNDKFAIAAWTNKEGIGIYFADPTAAYEDQDNITAQINTTLSKIATGYCEGLDLSAISPENFAVAKRLIIFNKKITTLGLYVWD